MLPPARAQRLKPLLDAFASAERWRSRIAHDPIEFPHRYTNPRDVEVVALLSTALAYGRVSLFKPRIEGILQRMGRSPADWVTSLTVPSAARALKGFVYRFNVASDLAVLLLGMGKTLRRAGSLEAAFLEGQGASWQASLGAFTASIREGAPLDAIERRMGPTRGMAHLLPTAQGGAAKRLNLYLRWMVRGPDAVDFGIWRSVSPSALHIPVDTHIARVSSWLGLTTRKTGGWPMVEEITASLRLLDAADPVRYDFALCHFGMSGACPVQPRADNCRRCPLKSECSVGRRAR